MIANLSLFFLFFHKNCVSLLYCLQIALIFERWSYKKHDAFEESLHTLQNSVSRSRCRTMLAFSSVNFIAKLS